jgi:hypothetical protein
MLVQIQEGESKKFYRSTVIKMVEIHRAEPLVPDPSPFEVEIAIPNLKKVQSPGGDQIPAELIQEGGEILRSEIHKFINAI